MLASPICPLPAADIRLSNGFRCNVLPTLRVFVVSICYPAIGYRVNNLNPFRTHFAG
jgi:hypothetical protein